MLVRPRSGPARRYVGEWRNNLRHGSGKFTCASDGKVYVGDFQDGLKHGQGTLHLPSGDAVAGSWEGGSHKGAMEFIHHADSAWHNTKL